MILSRRKAIALFGGGTNLAASSSIETFLATRTPHAPWSMAGGYDEPPCTPSRLAPCPHTLQPLSIELEGVDAFILRDDTTRRLPHTDPRDRQITIGLGCF